MIHGRRQWLTGLLDLCALAVLARGDQHGYGISEELERFGIGRVKGGTLYPMLARLEKEELVAHRWQPGDRGPARKYYAITASGRRRLADRGSEWLRFADDASALLSTVIEEELDDATSNHPREVSRTTGA